MAGVSCVFYNSQHSNSMLDMTPNRSITAVEGIGNAYLSASFLLSSILYIPKLILCDS